MGLVLVNFAVVNRRPVVLDFWPLPLDVAVPLSLIFLLSLILGVIWGSMASWLTTKKRWRRAREFMRRADRAESEVGLLRDRLRQLETRDGSANRSITENYEVEARTPLPSSKTV